MKIRHWEIEGIRGECARDWHQKRQLQGALNEWLDSVVGWYLRKDAEAVEYHLFKTKLAGFKSFIKNREE